MRTPEQINEAIADSYSVDSNNPTPAIYLLVEVINNFTVVFAKIVDRIILEMDNDH
jgi:hypothetical protein